MKKCGENKISQTPISKKIENEKETIEINETLKDSIQYLAFRNSLLVARIVEDNQLMILVQHNLNKLNLEFQPEKNGGVTDLGDSMVETKVNRVLS